MGCFATICCLSGLPIEAGDDVYYFLMTDVTSFGGGFVPVFDRYEPRTIPLRAKYSHYGSIEDYDELSPAVFSTLDVFKKDIVEKGVGDNSVHDVAVNTELTYEEVLNAIYENRIEVYPKGGSRREEKDGVPSISNIKDLISFHEIDLDSLHIDERGYGWVRVRLSSHDRKKEKEILEKAKTALDKKFSTMLTGGSGAYGFGDELQVMPKPGIQFLLDNDPKKLLVQQGMILGKVWDSLLKMAESSGIRSKIKKLQKSWSDQIELLGDRGLTAKSDLQKMLIDARRLTGVGSISSYVTNTFDEHIISAVERHIRHPFSEGQVKEFLASAEDFLSIMMLSQSNFYWLRPTYPNGPQFPNYLEQAEYFSCLYNVAYELAIKEEEENGR